MNEIIKLITETPSAVLIYILLINLITFCIFAIDKVKAMSGTWRISEKTLLGISLVGGALGGMLAMELCRHKTRKPLFRYGLPMMIVIHAAVLLKL